MTYQKHEIDKVTKTHTEASDMAKINSLSIRADVSRDKVRYILDVLRFEYPRAKIEIEASPEFAMDCDIESESTDSCFFVDGPMLERSLMSRVNSLINHCNSAL